MAPSQKVAEQLAGIAAANDKPAALEAILANIKTLSTPDTVADDIMALTDTLFELSPGIVATRNLLDKLILTVHDFGNNDLTKTVGYHWLATFTAQQTSSSYLDQAAEIRDKIAAAHENDDEFLEAAKCLAETPLDSSQRKVTDADRARVWVRIARNYLEVDDTTAAETYVNKLKNIMYDVTERERPADARDLNLHFRLCQARILDSNRDFLGASARYHEISLSPAIAEEERLHTLAMAIKCAILAPAGPLRSRTLGRLYKDERSAGLEEFGILEKIYLDRLLAQDEVDKFAQGLQPHQLATTADGSTVLAKAVVEHNLLGASKLYANIGIDALGVLLGLDADKAEETTARMIEQGRLVGRIDQLDRLIWFERGEASGEKGSGRAEIVVGKEIRQWDANIQSVSEELDHVTNALQKEFPVSTALRFHLLSLRTNSGCRSLWNYISRHDTTPGSTALRQQTRRIWLKHTLLSAFRRQGGEHGHGQHQRGIAWPCIRRRK
jgi:COP9 signalosome complex subunit 4